MSVPLALIRSQGPQGYLSPSWVSDRTWAPTWSYETVRLERRICVLPERMNETLERLVTAMERGHPRAWELTEMGDRYARCTLGVFPFSVEALEMTARFRFGQSERPKVWRELVVDNPHMTVAASMALPRALSAGLFCWRLLQLIDELVNVEPDDLGEADELDYIDPPLPALRGEAERLMASEPLM